ncbi:MAG: AI-2E family transporter, partial [Acidobacteriota bacterium]|nr:AI-2E family transporter [Acidobacteriota bacterium]
MPRPYLLGEKARLSTLYVFFALLGGLEAFGALGLFVGPVILAVAIALFNAIREELKSMRGISENQNGTGRVRYGSASERQVIR